MKYASGEHAWAICDRCGFRIAYLELRREVDTGLQVCAACEDEPEPKRYTDPDAIALRQPRPDPQEGEEAEGSYDGLLP